MTLTAASVRGRGRVVARLLSGSWRPASPPLAADDLRSAPPLLPLLIAGGGGALLERRLRATPGAAAHPLAEPLTQVRRRQILDEAVQERTLARVAAALQGAGIDPMVIKGWAIARHYPEPGLRPYGDIDLVVAPGEAARAEAVLQTVAPGVYDLHTGLARLDDRDPAERARRGEHVAIGGSAVRVLGPEDHLRLLCLHLLAHGAWRPVWLCDVAVALAARPALDWDYLLAGDPWRAQATWLAILLAHHLLDAPLDGAPGGRHRPTHPPRWLADALHAQWGRRSPPRGDRLDRGVLLHPVRLARALRARWPDPIEATAALEAPFHGLPRLPLQLADYLARATRWLGTAWRN